MAVKNFKKHLTIKAKCVRIVFVPMNARVAELADAQDLKSCGKRFPCRFDPDLEHQKSTSAFVLVDFYYIVAFTFLIC